MQEKFVLNLSSFHHRASLVHEHNAQSVGYIGIVATHSAKTLVFHLVFGVVLGVTYKMLGGAKQL